MPTRFDGFIYSQEAGIEYCPDLREIEGHSTVVVGLLKPGLRRPPQRKTEIVVIYCPNCGWIDPQVAHETDCPHVGHVLI